MRRRSGIPRVYDSFGGGSKGAAPPNVPPQPKKQQITPPSGGICPKSKRNPSPRTAAHKMRRKKRDSKGSHDPLQGIQGGGAPKTFPNPKQQITPPPGGICPKSKRNPSPEPRRIKCAAKAGFQRVSDPLAGDPRGQRPKRSPQPKTANHAAIGGICPESKRNPSPRTAAHKMRRRSGIPKGLMTLWRGIQGAAPPNVPQPKTANHAAIRRDLPRIETQPIAQNRGA